MHWIGKRRQLSDMALRPPPIRAVVAGAGEGGDGPFGIEADDFVLSVETFDLLSMSPLVEESFATSTVSTLTTEGFDQVAHVSSLTEEGFA